MSFHSNGNLRHLLQTQLQGKLSHNSGRILCGSDKPPYDSDTLSDNRIVWQQQVNGQYCVVVRQRTQQAAREESP